MVDIRMDTRPHEWTRHNPRQFRSKPLSGRYEGSYFKTVEELFPQWMTARIILRMWLDGIAGWIVTVDDPERGRADLGLSCKHDLLSLTPQEDRQKAWEIYIDTLTAYLRADFPQQRNVITSFLNGGNYSIPNNELGRARLKATVEAYEQDAVACGLPSIKEALAEAFGLGTHHPAGE